MLGGLRDPAALTEPDAKPSFATGEVSEAAFKGVTQSYLIFQSRRHEVLGNWSTVNSGDDQTWGTLVAGQTRSHQLHELLAWNWKAARERAARAGVATGLRPQRPPPCRSRSLSNGCTLKFRLSVVQKRGKLNQSYPSLVPSLA